MSLEATVLESLVSTLRVPLRTVRWRRISTYNSAVNPEYVAGIVPTRALPENSRYISEVDSLTMAENSGRLPLMLKEDANSDKKP